MKAIHCPAEDACSALRLGTVAKHHEFREFQECVTRIMAECLLRQSASALLKVMGWDMGAVKRGLRVCEIRTGAVIPEDDEEITQVVPRLYSAAQKYGVHLAVSAKEVEKIVRNRWKDLCIAVGKG